MNQNTNEPINIDFWFQDQMLVKLVQLLIQNDIRQFKWVEGQKSNIFKKDFQLYLMLNSKEEFKSEINNSDLIKKNKLQLNEQHFQEYITQLISDYKELQEHNTPKTLIKISDQILGDMNENKKYILNFEINQQEANIEKNRMELFQDFIQNYKKDQFQLFKKKRQASLKDVKTKQILLMKRLKINKNKNSLFFFPHKVKNQNYHQTQEINQNQSPLKFNLLKNIMSKQFFRLLKKIASLETGNILEQEFFDKEKNPNLVKWAILKEWKKKPEKLILNLYGQGIKIDQENFLGKIFDTIQNVSVPQNPYQDCEQWEENINQLIQDIKCIYSGENYEERNLCEVGQYSQSYSMKPF
ncbi:unnamed protein product [Paramecium sonneborni]|uniref:Uncharacterized protein n=1 Tax=Paramecium sonneborni TaxID=65129 RepID=A0A8S1MU68_9CILI|nr:unnamed protein product [Paramecium sonneborni]